MDLTAKRVRIVALRKERWKLEGKLMEKPREMLAGPLVTRYAPCGKLYCRCKKKGARGHGPYYYAQVKVKGKYTNVYLGKDKRLIGLAGNYSEYLERIVNLRRINREIDRLLEEINRSRIVKGVK
jgi:hypothetical protein